jgi:hypothetical protein
VQSARARTSSTKVLSLCTAVAGTAALLSGVGDERAMMVRQGYTWDARARY